MYMQALRPGAPPGGVPASSPQASMDPRASDLSVECAFPRRSRRTIDAIFVNLAQTRRSRIGWLLFHV
jgi:hypothetical protein